METSKRHRETTDRTFFSAVDEREQSLVPRGLGRGQSQVGWLAAWVRRWW